MNLILLEEGGHHRECVSELLGPLLRVSLLVRRAIVQHRLEQHRGEADALVDVLQRVEVRVANQAKNGVIKAETIQNSLDMAHRSHQRLVIVLGHYQLVEDKQLDSLCESRLKQLRIEQQSR